MIIKPEREKKMIFVTVGTHEQPFNRLVKAIDELKENGIVTEDVVIQTGFSTYEPRFCRWSKLFPYQEMAKNMLYITVGDKEKDEVVDIIINSAKSGQYGHYGDGKIFVSDISEAYTISEETREDDDE